MLTSSALRKASSQLLYQTLEKEVTEAVYDLEAVCTLAFLADIYHRLAELEERFENHSEDE